MPRPREGGRWVGDSRGPCACFRTTPCGTVSADHPWDWMPRGCHPRFGAAEVKGAKAFCSEWVLRHEPNEEETYVTQSMDDPSWYDPRRYRECRHPRNRDRLCAQQC